MSNLVCGTGTGNFPKPGDPDNSSTLTATSAFGGIDVEWTYPLLNPHAVAHTILYRGLSDKEDAAVRHKVVDGTFFYDKTTTATQVKYYYWIEFVSVNGTIGKKIGPASATARPTVQQVMEMLTGQIDAGVLAQSLKKSIDQIQLNMLGINAEMIERARSDDALGVSYAEVQAHSEKTRALLQEEVVARTTQDSAVVQAVNTLYANVDGTLAALQTQQTAMASKQDALAQSMSTAQTQLSDNIASVQTTMQSRIDTINGKVTEIGSLYTAKVDVNGLIGGFGVYNDGQVVEAGFDVDRFWVGRTTNKIKPFIIQDGMVYISQAAIAKGSIDSARIQDAAITSAKIANAAITMANISGSLQSDNFLQGTSGWRLTKSGEFEMNGNVVGQGRTVRTARSTRVYDASGRLRVQMGDLDEK